MSESQATPNQYSAASEFMRSRRPELFSDTVETSESIYPRSSFDYFLESITARNDERLFETFARRLAEKEMCPNLVPQTGPVGGGDSKVDSETYPVSEEIASAWYHNDGAAAGKERWAFAISAKKDWRSKCQSDVRKIAGTHRGYQHIVFITNQYVKDKTRGELQDALSEECNSRVTILDRTWILEKTYKNRRLEIAFEVFSLVPEIQRRTNQGPRDAERTEELEQLDNRLKNYSNYGGGVLRRAEDALDAALLARSLNRSKSEVDGRFQAALEILGPLANSPLSLRFRYAQAWTRFWWFDDAEGMERLYDTIFDFAVEEKNAWQLERVCNLWYCLISAERSGELVPNVARLAERGQSLAKELEIVGDKTAKTTNSYFARSLLAFLHVAMNPQSPDLDALVAEISDVLDGVENHADFPMDSVSTIFNELSNILGDDARLDGVLDKLLEIVTPRLSNESAADNLIERADKKLELSKPYEALVLLGRAMNLLRTVESRKESIYVFVRLGQAYESVGLLWAARAMLLRALERSLRPLREEQQLPSICISLAARLSWAELQLGRPTRVLNAIHLQSVYESVLGKPTKESKGIDEAHMRDSVLGILMLQTGITQLPNLSRLPDALEAGGLDLTISRGALLYALGYDSALEYEMRMTSVEIAKFFDLLSKQPARKDLPSIVNWHIGQKTTYSTKIVGSTISLEFEITSDNILMAESILSAVESYAATAIVDRWHPKKSKLRCTLRTQQGQGELFKYGVLDDMLEGSQVEITYDPVIANDASALGSEGDSFLELISLIVTTILRPRDEESIEKMLKNGEALNRTILALGLPIIHEIVFGVEQNFRIEHWVERTATTSNFQLLRSKSWQPTEECPFEESQAAKLQRKHSNIAVTDVINIEFWDAAQWYGAAAFQTGHTDFKIGLIYKNIDAGKRIFRAWRMRFGKKDENSILRIVVITGISKSNPLHYRMLISANPAIIFDATPSRETYFISRYTTMTPKDKTTLAIIEHIAKNKIKTFLAPVELMPTGPELIDEFELEIKELVVIPAWQIDENGIELTALHEDDDPIIPEGVVNAPVEQALRRLRTIKGAG